MKTTVVKLMMIGVLVLVTSCSKNPDKVLPKNDGQWNYNMSYSSKIVSTGEVDSDTEKGKITFKNDGTYRAQYECSDNEGCSVIGSWSASKNAVKMNYEGIELNFNVIKKELKYQQWETSEFETEYEGQKIAGKYFMSLSK